MLKMNIILILSALLTTVAAQQTNSLSCTYFHYGDGTYGCELTINNPNGFNNFTEIGGTHLEGYTNADVSLIYRLTGVSTNIPEIICDTFPNLIRIELYNTGLTEIGDNDFGSCSQVTEMGLGDNRISSISANAFDNLPDITYIYLDSNLLTTLPENVFANQQSLIDLDLSDNPFENIPGNLFRPLENLREVYLSRANLQSINNQWFVANQRLDYLYLPSNRIVLSEGNFAGWNALHLLHLESNEINEIPDGTFAGLPSLENLYLANNNFTELRANSFPDLEELGFLDISNNPIQIIHDGAFRGLRNLTTLTISNCRLRALQSNNFEDLENLTSLSLSFNEIEELSAGVFALMPNLNFISLWNNRLKTLRRNVFGTLSNLQTLDLERNIINAFDRAIINEAVNLNTLYFSGNLCANGFFGNFLISRDQYLPMLDICFRNMEFIVDTTTEGDAEFSFFQAPNPGIVLRVNTHNEVLIALTPFNFPWNPMIEILIGTANNTRSVIRINQETTVATVPTPNILTRDQWNDFRITWANQIILVFSGNNQFPFLGFTMQDFFNVNFYGLRAVETPASWTVQPFES